MSSIDLAGGYVLSSCFYSLLFSIVGEKTLAFGGGKKQMEEWKIFLSK